MAAVVRGEMVGNVMAAKTLSINQTVNGASCGLNQAPLSIDIENFPLSLPRNFGQKVLSNITLRPSTVHIIGAVHWLNAGMLHFIRLVVFAHYVLINIHIRECFNDTYWSGGPRRTPHTSSSTQHPSDSSSPLLQETDTISGQSSNQLKRLTPRHKCTVAQFVVFGNII